VPSRLYSKQTRRYQRRFPLLGKYLHHKNRYQSNNNVYFAHSSNRCRCHIFACMQHRFVLARNRRLRQWTHKQG
ncbi:hypothetical protein ACHAWC_004907, partial [Mediolabrus comicus]